MVGIKRNKLGGQGWLMVIQQCVICINLDDDDGEEHEAWSMRHEEKGVII